MSKAKAVMYGVKGTMNAVGAISTVTGHGALHVVCAMARVKIPGGMLAKLAKYQMDQAGKSFDKAGKEWDKN